MSYKLYGVKHHLFEHAAEQIAKGKAGYIVTSPFGMRNGKMHVGVDMVTDYDIGLGQGIDNIICPWAGMTHIEPFSSTSGNVCNVSSNKHVYQTNRHLASFATASGVTIKIGMKIGRMGSTGSVSTAAHLHYGILIDGNYVDPIPYLTGDKILPGMEDDTMGYPILTKSCKKGDKGDHVRNAQIVFEQKWLTPVNGVDGSFGNGMYNGVAQFQAEHKLPITHEVDQATLNEMNKEPTSLWRAEKQKVVDGIKVLSK